MSGVAVAGDYFDSDSDSLPGATELVDSTRRALASSGNKPTSETNYSDPEMDALLLHVDLDELESAGYASLNGTQEDKATSTPKTRFLVSGSKKSPINKYKHISTTTLPSKRRLQATCDEQERSPTTPAPHKLQKRRHFANTDQSAPLFLDPVSSSPTYGHDSSLQQDTFVATAPIDKNNDLVVDDECFVLDESLFTASPGVARTPPPARSPDRQTDYPLQSSAFNSIATDSVHLKPDPRRCNEANLANSAISMDAVSTVTRSPSPMGNDDYLAELEEWLNSGAVEITDK